MTLEGLSEKTLLNRCLAGERDAWEIFVEKYSDLVYHTIHKILRIYAYDFMYQDIEDLHNGIFLSLVESDYKKLRQYRGINGCTVASWIMSIATNMTLNFITRNKIHVSIDEASDDKESLKDIIPDCQPSVLEQLTDSEQNELLRQLMEGLNPSDKLFLKYYYEDDLAPEEIASIMSLSVSAIYSKKSRIIDKLRNIAREKNLVQEI